MAKQEATVLLKNMKTGDIFPCLISKVGWATTTYGYAIVNPKQYREMLSRAPEVEAAEALAKNASRGGAAAEPITPQTAAPGEIVKPPSRERKPVSAKMVPDPDF